MEHPLYYLWYAPARKLGFLWRCRIKQVKFRLRNGFWPDVCWNLDTTLAQLILPRLKHFRSNLNGYPANLTEEEWDRYLTQMIVAFEWIASGDYYDMPMKNGQVDGEAYTKLIDDTQRGLELFGKYYMGLWD